MLQRASALIDMHRPKGAAELLTQFLATEPDSADGHAMLARCLMELRRHKDAQRHIEEAIHLAPNNGYVHYVHSCVLIALESPGSARRAIDEALRLSPETPDYLAQSATLRCRLEQYDEAVQEAGRGLEFDPVHIECACERAFALMCLGKNESARLALEEILAQHPDRSGVHATLGWVAIQCGRYKVARSHFAEALRIDPNSAWAERGLRASCLRRLRFLQVMDEPESELQAKIGICFVLSTCFFLLWILPWLDSISVKSKTDLPIKSWIFSFPSLLAMTYFVKDVPTGLFLVLSSYGRRLMTRSQILAATLTWVMIPLSAAVLIVAEVQKDQAAYSLGCVLLWATPQLILLVTPATDAVRQRYLQFSLAYVITGGVHVGAVVCIQLQKGNIYGSAFWLTAVVHWFVVVAFCRYFGKQSRVENEE